MTANKGPAEVLPILVREDAARHVLGCGQTKLRELDAQGFIKSVKLAPKMRRYVYQSLVDYAQSCIDRERAA